MSIYGDHDNHNLLSEGSSHVDFSIEIHSCDTEQYNKNKLLKRLLSGRTTHPLSPPFLKHYRTPCYKDHLWYILLSLCIIRCSISHTIIAFTKYIKLSKKITWSSVCHGVTSRRSHLIWARLVLRPSSGWLWPGRCGCATRVCWSGSMLWNWGFCGTSIIRCHYRVKITF